jgi:hypothetical protein
LQKARSCLHSLLEGLPAKANTRPAAKKTL